MPNETSAGKGVLLDTSILIELLRGNGAVQTALDALLDQGLVLATSAVCVAELYAGMKSGEEGRTSRLIRLLECLPLTEEIARAAGELRVSRAKEGRTHSILDLMIAATAIDAGYSVATENRRDFEIPGLVVAAIP